MSNLVDQPSVLPTRKVAAVGLAGSASAVLIWGAAQFGLEIPTEVATGIVVLMSAAAGYFVRDRDTGRL